MFFSWICHGKASHQILTALNPEVIQRGWYYWNNLKPRPERESSFCQILDKEWFKTDVSLFLRKTLKKTVTNFKVKH